MINSDIVLCKEKKGKIGDVTSSLRNVITANDIINGSVTTSNYYLWNQSDVPLDLFVTVNSYTGIDGYFETYEIDNDKRDRTGGFIVGNAPIGTKELLVNSAINNAFRPGDIICMSGSQDEFCVIESVTSTSNFYKIVLATPLIYNYKDCVIGTTKAVENLHASCSVIFGEKFIKSDHILAYNNGCVNHTITISFNTDSEFKVISDTYGDLGNGSISSKFSPINKNTTIPFFELKRGCFIDAKKDSEIKIAFTGAYVKVKVTRTVKQNANIDGYGLDIKGLSIAYSKHIEGVDLHGVLGNHIVESI